MPGMLAHRAQNEKGHGRQSCQSGCKSTKAPKAAAAVSRFVYLWLVWLATGKRARPSAHTHLLVLLRQLAPPPVVDQQQRRGLAFNQQLGRHRHHSGAQLSCSYAWQQGGIGCRVGLRWRRRWGWQLHFVVWRPAALGEDLADRAPMHMNMLRCQSLVRWAARKGSAATWRRAAAARGQGAAARACREGSAIMWFANSRHTCSRHRAGCKNEFAAGVVRPDVDGASIDRRSQVCRRDGVKLSAVLLLELGDRERHEPVHAQQCAPPLALPSDHEIYNPLRHHALAPR